MSDQMQFPEQCIKTAEAMISAYGYEGGMEVMGRFKENIEDAHERLSNQITSEQKLNLALQADFWSQCIQSQEDKPVLERSFFESLNITPKNLNHEI